MTLADFIEFKQIIDLLVLNIFLAVKIKPNHRCFN